MKKTKNIVLLTHFFSKAMSVSIDQPHKMRGEDSDQFPRFFIQALIIQDIHVHAVVQYVHC